MKFTLFRNRKSGSSVIIQWVGELEQEAKQRGAAAGRHKIEDDFEKYVDSVLHLMFVSRNGELGPEPEVLLQQRQTLEKELEQLLQPVDENVGLSALPRVEVRAVPRLSRQLALGVVLFCTLAGLGCDAAGLEITWRGVAFLGALAGLIILILQALPGWACTASRYFSKHAKTRRVRRLEKEVRNLKKTEWKQTELRNLRDQFVEVRKRLLMSIFELYKAGGDCVARSKGLDQKTAA